MNHIKLRRLALSVASWSFGSLAAVLLLWSASAENQVLQIEKNIIEPIGSDSFQQAETVSLPAPISCTPLVVEQLAAYDGKYFEDGTGREVMDVAAIMLYNSSDQLVPYAYITIYTESYRYSFDAFLIPPRSSVLVPEADAQKFMNQKIMKTFGWMTVDRGISKASLQICELGGDCVKIQNLSGQRLRDLTIHHRSYLADDGFYMGGRTFQTNIPELPPGETVIIHPANFMSGYSKVVYYE